MPFGKELAAGREFDEPGPRLILIVIANVDVALAVERNTVRAVEREPAWATCEWHAGRGDEPGSGSGRAPSTGRQGTIQQEEEQCQDAQVMSCVPHRRSS